MSATLMSIHVLKGLLKMSVVSCGEHSKSSICEPSIPYECVCVCVCVSEMKRQRISSMSRMSAACQCGHNMTTQMGLALEGQTYSSLQWEETFLPIASIQCGCSLLRMFYDRW